MLINEEKLAKLSFIMVLCGLFFLLLIYNSVKPDNYSAVKRLSSYKQTYDGNSNEKVRLEGRVVKITNAGMYQKQGANHNNKDKIIISISQNITLILNNQQSEGLSEEETKDLINKTIIADGSFLGKNFMTDTIRVVGRNPP